jgi:hypothetical protein
VRHRTSECLTTRSRHDVTRYSVTSPGIRSFHHLFGRPYQTGDLFRFPALLGSFDLRYWSHLQRDASAQAVQDEMP